MIKDHPVIAVLGLAGAVGLGAIALSSHYTAEPLRDRIDAQEALLVQQKEEIQHLRDELSHRPRQVPRRSEQTSNSPDGGSTVDAPVSAPRSPSTTGRVSRQTYEGFLVELTDADAVGTSISFIFRITNTNPHDKQLGIASHDRGNMRFLGFYSTFLADGNQHVATETSIAGDRNFMVIPGGQAVRATVTFADIPPDLTAVDHLTLRVTTGGAYPSHRLTFGPIELSR